MYYLPGQEQEHHVVKVSYAHKIWGGYFDCLLHMSLTSLGKLHMYLLALALLGNMNTLPSTEHRTAETFLERQCRNDALLILGNLH